MKTILPTLIALLAIGTTHVVAINIPATEDVYVAQPKNRFTGATGKSTVLVVSPTSRALIRFEIDGFGIPSRQVLRASLRVYINGVKSVGEIEFRSVDAGVNGSWTEDAERNSTGPALDPTAGATVTVSDKRKRFVRVDVTELVKLWLDDPTTNNGVAILSKDGFASIRLGSKEGFGSGYPAELEIESNPALPLLDPLTGNLDGANIVVGSVGSSQIGTAAVTNSTIANNAVSTSKLADGSVTNAKIADGAVSSAKLANSAVGIDALEDASVRTVKIADGAVTSEKLASGLAISGDIIGTATNFTGMLSGEITGTQSNTAISAVTVTGKSLTGFLSMTGALTASDSILSGIGKLDGNVALKAPIDSPVFTGTVVVPAGTTTTASLRLSSGVSLSTPTFGAVEFDGTNLFLTVNNVIPTRKVIAFTDTTLSISQIPDGSIPSGKLVSGLSLAGTTTGTFSGDGSALTNLTASNITGQIVSPQLASDLTLAGTTTGAFNGNLTGNVSGSSATFTGALSGDVTGRQTNTAISAATVTGKSLTGLFSTPGVIAASDSILSGIGKLDGNINLKASIHSPVFTGIASGTFSGDGSALTNLTASNITGQIVSSQFSSNLTLAGTTTGTFSGNLTGNVSGSSATFTGTLSGDVAGQQGATTVVTVGGVAAASVATASNLANSATSGNTPNSIVMRDASGNFSAGTITATLSAGSVGNTQLAHNAVQTVNILDASVTSAKISNGAIGSLALEAAAVTPSKLAPDCAVFLEEAATVDSSSGSSGIGWEVRKLNGGRVFPATGGSISRSGNTITLQPGTYYVSAEAAVGDIYQNQLILRDVTTGTGGIPNGAQAVIRGMSGVSNGGSSPNSLKGIITVGATAKNFELWHYTGTYSPSLDGFGQATSGGPDPRYGTEILPIYCQIAIIRLQ